MPFRFNPFTDKLDLTETGGIPPGGGIQTVTGNTGGAVGPDMSNNVNLLGAGAVTVSGNPGTNTLTISLAATVATTYTANTGSATPALNNLNVLATVVAAGTTPFTSTGAGSTITYTVQRSQAAGASAANIAGIASFNSAQFSVDANGYVSSTAQDLHISPYIVSPTLANGASFTTIQSAINAANAAGGGVVYIQPASYTENLTLFNGVHLYGTPAVSQNQGATTTITGTHTPPASGQVAFNSICFISTTDVFSSVAAGTTHLAFLNCESAVQNGYFLNLLNWTGILEIYDNNPNTAGAPFAVNDGGINNTGGSTILVFSASVGSGTNVMNLSGPVITEGASFGAPVNFQTGSNINLQGHEFLAPVTFSNNTTGVCYFCDFEGGASPAITMSSSGAISLLHGVVNSSNNPAIAGSGAGVLTYANLSFRSNAAIAGTLTLATISWRPYAQAIAATDGTKVGTAAFNSAQFTVDAAGFVSLSGTGAAQTITGNSGGALSPTAGNWNIFGAAVAAGTTPVATAGTGSTLTVNVQRSQAIASTNASNVGLAAFNSAQFTVDANGFVSSLGIGVPWIDQGTSITLANNTGYYATAAVTLTLPASPVQGTTVKIICDTASTVVLTANTGQTIRQGNLVSSTAGTFTNSLRGDALELFYRAATTQWIALNGNGVWVAA